METKHTPGPWRVMTGTRLEVHGPRDKIGWPAVISYNCGMPQDETAKANARLIAAAPELLEALRDLEYQFGGETDAVKRRFADARTKARAAISKATGETA